MRAPATGNNNAGWRRSGAVLLGFFDAAAVRFDAGNSCAKLRFKAAFRSMTGGGAVISFGFTVRPFILAH